MTGARAPVALHWARLLTGAGHQVWLADTLAAPLGSASRLMQGYLRLPSPRFAPEAFATAVEQHSARLGIEMILPTCEEVFHLAHLAERGLVTTPLFAPSFSALSLAHNKYHFIQTCAEIGLRTPRTTLIETREALLAVPAQAHVFKPVWSRFGKQVRIRPNNLRGIAPCTKQPWIAQEVLDGEEISVYAIAVKGQLRALSAYRAGARAGKGASIVFDPVCDDPVIDDIAARYIEATQWHGQISFDLKRDASGHLRPIECNPRATSGLHFFLQGSALLQALACRDGAMYRPECTTPLGSKLALLLYGKPVRQPRRFAALWRDTRDIHDWPEDSLSAWQQIKGLREILTLAFNRKISPQAASTFDIEWNGPEAGSYNGRVSGPL